jgi:hypothetical protein
MVMIYNPSKVSKIDKKPVKVNTLKVKVEIKKGKKKK